MAWLESLTLENDICRLVPLSHDHHDDLVDAVKDGEVWKLFYAGVPHPDNMKAEIRRRLALQESGTMLPFTVINAQTQRVVGMTTYCWVESANRRVSIGWTWYAKSQWRTALNSACKRMLLAHAFESLDCIAVGFRVDSFNQRSRQAVERLGAKWEGMIRNYSIMPNGVFQDMHFYSILISEWPRVKSQLDWLSEKYKADG